MKDGFRQCMAWLHTWTGLVVGWVLFFVFVTGTVGYFDDEITRWMQPERPLVTHGNASVEQGLVTAQAQLSKHAANAARWIVSLPSQREDSHWRIHWPNLRENLRFDHGHRLIDPLTGDTVIPGIGRKTIGGVGLYSMHYLLRYLPADAGILIVGVCTMLMLLAIVSGVITHKKIFSDFFTFRRAKGQRSWLDAHNLISVTALPFFVMITYSGLVFFMDYYQPAGMKAVLGWDAYDGKYVTPLNPRVNARFDPQYLPQPETVDPRQGSGQPASLVDLHEPLEKVRALWGDAPIEHVWIEHPGQEGARITFIRRGGALLDSSRLTFDGVSGELLDIPPRQRGTPWNIQDVLINLHEGHFAEWGLRWLYFLSGLLGCAMIATGLVLWTVKRRVKQDKRLKAGQSVELGFRLVEALNIGTIAGLCTAVAVYFWANRLLPVQFTARAEWEFHCMFIAWGLLLLHAAVRLRFAPSLRVWQEQLWIAALAYGLIPLLNWATTDRHLGVTVPYGDWVLAGFDLTVLALGVFFAAAALKVRRKAQAASQHAGKALRNAPRPALAQGQP